MNDSETYKSFMKSKYRSTKHTSYFYAYDHFLNKYRNFI